MRKSFILFGMLTILLAAIALATVPTVVNYQGQLTDSGGSPVADGSYSMTFTIYDDPTAGSVLWSSGVRQVDVTDGLFSYILGDSVPLFSSMFATDSNLWLGITVDADPEMTPRSLLTSTPKTAIASGVFGDIKTSRGSMYIDNGSGNDSDVVISNEVSALDHRGHVTILKISNNGADTSNMVGMYADDEFQHLYVGDDDGSDSGIVVGNSVDKHKHRGHVTILKISNNGSDTTGLISMSAAPDSQSLSMGDDNSPDSGTVLIGAVDGSKHKGHVTILKISNNGSDSTGLISMSATPDSQSLSMGDGNAPDSGTVLLNAVDKHKHRGHVTILKISNNGSDSTELMSMSAAPDSQSLSMGDGSSSDSGIVISNSTKQVDHRGHVTILKISNNGADTSNMVGMYADDEFQNLYVGDDDGSDSGIVVGNSVDKHKHRGHVTILKISNNGADTTDLVSMSATPTNQSLSLGESTSPDSGIVISTSTDQFRHRGHVTVLKISNNGSDTTDLVTMGTVGASPNMYVGDYTPDDSGMVVTSSVDAARHRGHVTVLKISSGGADTTDIISMSGDGDQASIQLNGGGGSGGSIYLLADSSTDGGKIGVNNNSPTYEVDVTGTICATNGLCAPSDIRYKKDVTALSNGLELIESLNPVRYNWRSDEFPEKRFSGHNEIGFIAQEIKEILPELVSRGTDGYYSLDYAKLTPVLVQALKEQQSEIKTLTERLEHLERMVTTLTKANNSDSPELGLK